MDRQEYDRESIGIKMEMEITPESFELAKKAAQKRILKLCGEGWEFESFNRLSFLSESSEEENWIVFDFRKRKQREGS